MSNSDTSKLYKVEYSGNIDDYLIVGVEEYEYGTFEEGGSSFFGANHLSATARFVFASGGADSIAPDRASWRMKLVFGIDPCFNLLRGVMETYLSDMDEAERIEECQNLICSLISDRIPDSIDPSQN